MQDLSDYATWVLCGVSAYLAKRTLDNDRTISTLELKMEREFQRKDGLKELITEAVQVAISPMMSKVEAHEAKIDRVLDEVEAQWKDINLLLDKFEVPATQRHG